MIDWKKKKRVGTTILEIQTPEGKGEDSRKWTEIKEKQGNMILAFHPPER